MIFAYITVACTVAGLFFTGVGIIFIYRQIRSIDRQIRSASSAALHREMLEIDRFFIQYPELRPYIYSNKSLQNHAREDFDKLSSLAEMMCDICEHVYLQRETISHDLWPRWLEYMQFIHDHSPIMRKHLRDFHAWYTTDFLRLIDRSGLMPSDEDYPA